MPNNEKIKELIDFLATADDKKIVVQVFDYEKNRNFRLTINSWDFSCASDSKGDHFLFWNSDGELSVCINNEDTVYKETEAIVIHFSNKDFITFDCV